MTDLPTKIAALEEAAASGVLTIESDGDRQTFQRMPDLLSALAYFKAQQAAALPASVAARPASTVVVFDPR
ncbi:phage head-tail joining protein [Sphingomonas sp. PAMC 26605]|uniref:phage head-tail joining protein n=1 Tax=Sphingomonas sp. PAMC 26605 TaxID=1112214 RepID=UPI00026CDCB7|nr:hypothetical protein [Sphingomonas sp. PAMC 26605]